MRETQFQEAALTEPPNRRLLHDLGYFGHYLHLHAGGRGGKQFVIISLVLHGGEMSQRDLLEHACISSASLSEVLAKLEAEGLVTRTKSEEDRRLLAVALTEAGREKAEEVLEYKNRFEEESFACFDEQERTQLLDYLDRLVRHWHALEENEEVPACRN
ncbi:MAG: MarR family winged helix-turn-helix transcriptional regulator [Olsenella sp.]